MAVAEYELYKRIKLLGEGSFGKAYLVECIKDNSLCVIKQMDLTKMADGEKRATLKEAKILEALIHPNIIRFREVYKTKRGRLCIVMDFADGGDLASRIRQQKGVLFSEEKILDWFTQICLAIKHVHDRKILHRDLKCQNIFLTKNDIVKLGDFGIAKVLNFTLQNARTIVGTPYYISPEIIENHPYSFKSDIWSLGVVLYELCSLKHPFIAEKLHFLAMKIVKGAYQPLPTVYSKELRQLVDSMLKVDPAKRPTISQILAYPLIQSRIKKFLSESQRISEFSHTILHKHVAVDVRKPNLDEVKRVNKEEPQPAVPLPGPSMSPLLPLVKKNCNEPVSVPGKPLTREKQVNESRDSKEALVAKGVVPNLKVGINPPPPLAAIPAPFPVQIPAPPVQSKESQRENPKAMAAQQRQPIVVKSVEPKIEIIKNVVRVSPPTKQVALPAQGNNPNPWSGIGNPPRQPTPKKSSQNQAKPRLSTPSEKKSTRPQSHQSNSKECPPKGKPVVQKVPPSRQGRKTIDEEDPKRNVQRPHSQNPNLFPNNKGKQTPSNQNVVQGKPLQKLVKKADTPIGLPQVKRPESQQALLKKQCESAPKPPQAPSKLVLPPVIEKDGKKPGSNRDNQVNISKDMVDVITELQGIVGDKLKVAAHYDDPISISPKHHYFKENEKDEDREDDEADDNKENLQNLENKYKKEDEEIFEYMIGDHSKLQVNKSTDYEKIEAILHGKEFYEKLALKHDAIAATREEILKSLHLLFMVATFEDKKTVKK